MVDQVEALQVDPRRARIALPRGALDRADRRPISETAPWPPVAYGHSRESGRIGSCRCVVHVEVRGQFFPRFSPLKKSAGTERTTG